MNRVYKSLEAEIDKKMEEVWAVGPRTSLP